MIDQEIKKDSEQEIRKRVQLNAKSFGVVAYAEANFYSDDKYANGCRRFYGRVGKGI